MTVLQLRNLAFQAQATRVAAYLLLVLAPASPVKFKPVMNDLVTQRLCDFVLELLNLVGVKLNDIAGIDINQMVVMISSCRLEARWAAFKGMAMDGADTFQQLHGAIDGGERNAGIDLNRAIEDFHGVGMITGLCQNA